MKRAFFLAAMSALIGLPALAHEPGAHVHGVARLQVAVEGDTLTLTLESPLDNLLGFEHRPRTEKQKAAVRDMAARLRKAEPLFVPTPAAECRAESVTLESPVLAPEKKDGGDGHADLDGEFVFRCAKPEALRGIEVRLFDAFDHLRRVDVQVVTGKGQSAAKLTPAQKKVGW